MKTIANSLTRISISEADSADLQELTNMKLFLNIQDAGRDALRRGIREIRNERHEKLVIKQE